MSIQGVYAMENRGFRNVLVEISHILNNIKRKNSINKTKNRVKYRI